jgi:hypothetical protein
VVEAALYRDGVRVSSPASLADTFRALREQPAGMAWIGLARPTDGELHSLAAEFDLHPLAVEDAIKAHQRPKLERYGGPQAARVRQRDRPRSTPSARRRSSVKSPGTSAPARLDPDASSPPSTKPAGFLTTAQGHRLHTLFRLTLHIGLRQGELPACAGKTLNSIGTPLPSAAPCSAPSQAGSPRCPPRRGPLNVASPCLHSLKHHL